MQLNKRQEGRYISLVKSMGYNEEVMEFLSLALMRYEICGSGDRLQWILKQLHLVNNSRGE